MNQYLEEDDRRIKQDFYTIKLVVFMILTYDLLSIVISFITKDFNSINGGSLFWDIFFSYHMLKMKEWARKWTIARTIIGMVFLTYTYLSGANLLAWFIDIPILFCILILLFGKGSKRKTIITISIYSFLVIIIIGMLIWGQAYQKYTKNIIQGSPLLTEQKSNKGFKIKLPSYNWRFLKKEDASKVIGKLAKNYDIVVSDISGKVCGLFIGEDLTNIKDQLNLDQIAQYLKKEVMPNYKIINERKGESNLLIESQYTQYNTEYIFMAAYNILNRVGVTSYFWGELKDYYRLRNDIYDLLNNISESSRKEYLVKISPKEIYENNNEAVVLVRIYDKEGKLVGFSSGFNVLKEGLIVTNLHSILPGYYMDVKFPNHGVYEEVYIAGLSKTLHDLVILKINGKNLPNIDLNNSIEAEIGDDVIVIGNPEGFINTISEGILSGIRNMDGYPYYQITAPISGGSSGAPVFDLYGNIIGICVATIEPGQNLNFCIPINELGNIETFQKYVSLDQFRQFIEEELKKIENE